MSETFGYDSLNRLTSTSVNLSPTPLNKSFTYDLVGNITSKSDVGTYSYPSPGQPLPHGVASISGGLINTTFSYDSKGNMTSGNGLTVSYASYNKPSSITRGTNTIGFSHDPEHNRYKQVAPGGTTLYLGSAGAMAEMFTGSGGAVTWTNYLTSAGGLVGMHVENVGGSTLTRYFHKDHLGSVAVITDESGTVLERLSFDAWGKRRYPTGADDPSGSIASQTNRGFTGHEELDAVGLVHMNGRVYDPLLARFGTPDPTTESPFSTQGWNRYSYVGNSPVNFTDPSGYCFMGCFWQPIFRDVQNLLRQFPIIGNILTIAAAAWCGPAAPLCAGIAATITSMAVAGITSGKLGVALRAGFVTAVTAFAMFEVGEFTSHGDLKFGSDIHLENIAGHALVGCASAVANRGRCGSGALSGATGSFAGPLLAGLGFESKLIATSVLGGLASVAGGGKFANGAITAAFGYLFNERGNLCDRGYASQCLGGTETPAVQGDKLLLFRSWELSPASAGGFVIQEVTITDVVDGAPRVVEKFWEAWEIEKGQTMTTSPRYGGTVGGLFYNDEFSANSDATGTLTAKAAFYEGVTLGQLQAMGFSFNNPQTPLAGTLPAMSSQQGTPILPAPSTPIVTRSWP
jgi:RHS repeat-associated protein